MAVFHRRPHPPHMQNHPRPQKVSSAPPASPHAVCAMQRGNCMHFPQMHLSILRYKYLYTHIHNGRTALESTRCFIVLASFKYFHSMDFDCNCLLLTGLRWAGSCFVRNHFKALVEHEYNFSKFAYGCLHVCGRINTQHV